VIVRETRGLLLSGLIAIAALLLAALVMAGCSLLHDDGCEGDSVFHPPAGICIIPNDLLLTSPDRQAVQAAIEPFGGHIVTTVLTSYHFVRFPVDGLQELDRIKEELSRAGWDVQYHRVGSNSRNP
jgi:hypothetical protein